MRVKELRGEHKKKASKPMFVKNLLAPCLLTCVSNRDYSSVNLYCNHFLGLSNRLANMEKPNWITNQPTI